MLLKTANKTALNLLLNVAIGFGLSIAWNNNMLMTYWLIFSLTNVIFKHECLLYLIKEGKINENSKS